MCKRTFSTFTGSPAAYSKRIELWPRYCECMVAALSLRRCAFQLKIALSTAFRWRHAILNAARALDRTLLRGEVEVHDLRLAHSMKGSRHLGRPPRVRSARDSDPFLWRTRRVSVVLAWARADRGYSRMIEWGVVRSEDLRDCLQSRLLQPATIFSRSGPYSAYAILARAAGASFRWVRSNQPDFDEARDHTKHVVAFGHRLLDFLLPFRGVATKYLENYLQWHRMLEARATA